MLPYMWANQDKCVCTAAAELVDGTTIFTITGGPIRILDILSVCITENGATATTLQWKSHPTVGTATTFSGASASLANAAAGATLRLNNLSLAAAPALVAATSGGVQVGTSVPNAFTVQQGTIKIVVGVGSSTGTWKHYMTYKPMGPDSIVVGGY